MYSPELKRDVHLSGTGKGAFAARLAAAMPRETIVGRYAGVDKAVVVDTLMLLTMGGDK